jgi:hypothetical protein
MIAYAAVQVLLTVYHVPTLTSPSIQTYIALSCVEWGTTDGTFNFVHFYHLIIKTISNSNDEWVAETMDWWQKYVASA